MRIVEIDDQSLNGAEGITIYADPRGAAGSRTIGTTIRQRAGLAPLVEDTHAQTVQLRFEVKPESKGDNRFTGTVEAFHFLVNGIFDPERGKRVLTAQYDPEDPASLYTTEVYITSFGRSVAGYYVGTFEMLSRVWHATTEDSTSTSPVAITGNVPALPTLTITGGNAVTRQRATFTDRTGHGVAAYLVSVEPSAALSEANYEVWANGLRIPFAFVSGRLYFRIDCPPPPERTFVDIYHGASIANTTTAGELDSAGTDLAASLASGEVDADTAFAVDNPIAPSLAWHPSITVPHNSRRDYVFGLNGTDIELIDQNAAGERTNLPDDADSYVMVMSEALRIRNLSLSVFSGYQKSISEAAGSSGSRRMRVRLAAKDSFGATNDEFHYVQWTFGNLTYPSTELITHADGSLVWHEVAHVEDFITRTAEAIGITPTQGEEGVYYLNFSGDSFAGQDIPLLQMSSSRRQPIPDFEGDVDPSGDTGPIPAHLFQADWVDPATNEPFEDDPDTADLLPVPLKGQIRVRVAYRTRDSEHWIRAWSQVVTGSYPSGNTATIGPLSVDTPGAVQIAIGLEPVAAKPSIINWGVLEITSVPIIDLDTTKTPSAVVSADIPALHINGSVRNMTTGATVTFTNYFADSNGVQVDTSELTIGGTDGVGVVHGQPNVNRGAAMFQLMPGSNDWETTGDLVLADVVIAWRERLAV